MIYWTAFFLVWVACGIYSYWENRRDTKKRFSELPWTVGDRVWAIFISLFGPVSALLATLSLIENADFTAFLSRPAKW